MKEFKPNKDQQEGLIKLEKFKKSSERVFVLSGKAGTGKSTLLKWGFEKEIIHDLGYIKNTKEDMITGYKYKLAGLAVANKAKDNLKDKGGIPYATTFAKAYGHKETFDEITGERNFVPDKKKIKYADCKKNFEYFIIDEVSMFSQKMLDLVFNQTNLFAKIIFLGDRGQLPPILEKGEVDKGEDSPVWDLTLPDYCKHELKTRVRQTENNPIIDISDVIYDEIFKENPDVNNILPLLQKDSLFPDGSGVFSVQESEVYDLFKTSSVDYLDTKIIAYTRKTVGSFNNYMRNYIHCSPKEMFIEGEIIYMNSSYYGENTDGLSFSFHNSSEFIIKSIEEGELNGFKVYYTELRHGQYMPVLSGKYTSKNQRAFRDMLKEYADKKQWKFYWDMKAQYGDFSYGYALTAYKAQGSTYKTIFVAVKDILGLKSLTDKRKLQCLYTAITRASHNVYFLFD